MTTAQVFLARPGAGAFERKLLDTSEFDYAGAIDVDGCEEAECTDDPTPLHALEDVFAITNSYPGELHCAESYALQVVAWRHNRNRSLSVGDVVALGEGFWFCASIGWELVPPTANLIDAFMSANRHQLTGD